MVDIVNLTGVGIDSCQYDDPYSIKKWISTQLDRYIPDKIRKNHKLYTLFIKTFIEFIEEIQFYKSCADADDIIYNSTSSRDHAVFTASSIIYTSGQQIFYQNRYYDVLDTVVSDSSNEILTPDQDEMSAYYKFVDKTTLGIYEHTSNINDNLYINPDYLTKDYTKTNFIDLHIQLIDEIASGKIHNIDLMHDISGQPLTDLIVRAKEFNTLKGTPVLINKFITWINDKIEEITPTGDLIKRIAFGETRAGLVNNFLWDNTHDYKTGEFCIYNRNDDTGNYVYVYNALTDNTGSEPSELVSCITWEYITKYMVFDDQYNTPLIFNENFVYWIHNDNFDVSNLIKSIHPSGWIANVAYFPFMAKNINQLAVAVEAIPVERMTVETIITL